MKVKPYPKTKPSGIEWLGDIPAHWEVKRLKYVTTINDDVLSESTLPDHPIDYVDIGSVDPIHGITTTEEFLFENAPSRARRMVRHGDTIVSTVRTYLRAIAPIRDPSENLIVSTGFAVVRPFGLQTEYTAFALREPGFVDSIVARSTGVSYPACNASTIADLPVPLPPLSEQKAIAEFLDRETGRIDVLVEKKRTLIERLKEKRSALISACVTRGLPAGAGKKYPRIVQIYAEELQKSNQPRPSAFPADQLPENPPLNPSGIEWLGNVPEHWEVKGIKWDTPVFRGASPRPIDDPVYFDDEGEFAWVRIADVTEAGDYLEHTTQRLSHLGSSLSVKIHPGALFLSIAGTVGKPCITKIKCCIHDGFVYFPKFSGETKFLFYVFASGEPYKGLGKLGTQLNLNTDTVGSIPIPLPPLPEQIAIAAYLDEETAIIDALVAKVETAIERLLEYRSALISAAVTGKIDVRKDASLPVEGPDR